MEYVEPADAVASVPPGAWAVGVSGGADSVALLSLLRGRSDLSLHVAHLDHETRGDASTGDAEFVAELAARWGLPCTVARLGEIVPEVPAGPSPTNPSARYRAARLALFRRVVRDHRLHGVVLAHHADDNAETVLHRLLRGPSASGLAGMAARTVVGGLTVLRPLLPVRRAALREYLIRSGQPWREDESNESDRYVRNRLRRVLRDRPELTHALLNLGRACADLRDWVRANTPDTGVGRDALPASALRALPLPLAREAARRWLAARNAPPDELTGEVLDRLLEMAADAASPPRRHFPGGLLVRRRAGQISVDGAGGTAQ